MNSPLNRPAQAPEPLRRRCPASGSGPSPFHRGAARSALLTTLITLSLALSGFAATSAAAQDAASPRSVRQALDSLIAWLNTSTDKNSAAWRRYLKLELLRQQLAKPEAASAEQIGDVLSRFESGARGLELPHFAALRRSLAAWHAELAQPSPDQLPQLARHAKDEFTVAVDEAGLEQARADLKRSADELAGVLRRGGANGRRWLEFLRWGDLEVALEEPDTVDLPRVEGVLDRFASGHRGLQLDRFRNTGEALRRFVARLRVLRDPDARDEQGARLDRLAELLEAVEEEVEADRLAEMGPILGWLERRNLAPRLTQAVRRRYSRTNMLMQASADFLAIGLEEPVNQIEPIHEVILGTSISGTGHTTGRVRFALVPNETRALMDAVFEGRVASRSIGANRSARLSTRGTTFIGARKRIELDTNGISAWPTRSDAKTNSQITGIWSTRPRLLGRIVVRVASRRAAESKGASEAIASRRAEQRFNRRMDERLREMQLKGNDIYWNEIRQPLWEIGQFPEEVRFRTTRHWLSASLLQADPDQFAAPTPPPALTELSDVAVRVHQSMIDNLAEGILTRTGPLSPEVLEQEAMRMFGEVPEALKPREDREPWEIEFWPRGPAELGLPRPPIQVWFDDNTITIRLRPMRFRSGERDVDAMNVTAVYRLETTPEGLKAIRVGDLHIVAPDIQEHLEKGVPLTRRPRPTMSVREQSGARIIRRRLEQTEEDRELGRDPKLFPLEVELDNFVLPDRLARLGEMTAVEFGAEEGWLTLSWRAKAGTLAARHHAERGDAEPLAVSAAR